MPDGRHSTDRRPRDGLDGLRVSHRDRLAHDRCDEIGVDPVRPGRKNEHRAGCTHKQQALDDRFDAAAQCTRCLLGGVGRRVHLLGLDLDAQVGDTESESLIQKSLNALVKDRTTFVIAHRLSTIRQATEILVIEHGVIAERGTHTELIAKQGRYFDLYTYQARI